MPPADGAGTAPSPRSGSRGPRPGEGPPRRASPGAESDGEGGARELLVVRPDGRVPYREGLRLQRRLARERIEGRRHRDVLLLVEHDPVLTLGRNAEAAHLTADRRELTRRGVDVVEIERGGDVTYHGPGQLVGYPVLDLRDHRRDLHWYLRTLEGALVATLAELGLSAFRIRGHTGVWVGEETAAGRAAGPRPSDDGARAAEAAGRTGATGAGEAERAILSGRVRKVASIGVHVRRWVTWHGFALNVTHDPLENFDLIVPCGIQGVTMTSLEQEGVPVDVDGVRDAAAEAFARTFGLRPREATAGELREAARPAPATAGRGDGSPRASAGPGRSGDASGGTGRGRAAPTEGDGG